VQYRLALPLSAQPANSGDLDPISKFVRVTSAVAAVALQLNSVKNIVGCGYVKPDRAASSKTRNGQNE